MTKGYIIDWTALEEFEVEEKNFPFEAVKNLQEAVKKFVSQGEIELAEKVFEVIKIFFK